MNETEQRALLDRLAESLLAVPYRWEYKASYFLASDDSRAADWLRDVAPKFLESWDDGVKEYWQNIEFWLTRSPVERCLAHVRASRRIDALALLIVDNDSVGTIVETLIEVDEQLSKSAEPLFGLCTLASLTCFRGCDPAIARELMPRLRMSRWIEERERASNARHPKWARLIHPAIDRDPLGGALMKVVLAADPLDLLPIQLVEELPGRWILYGNLDNTKALNDNLGHLAGDVAIFGAIQTMQRLVGDHVIRVGGDQFVIVHDGPDGPEVAERLRGAIESARFPAIRHLDQPVQVTISFGVVPSGKTEHRLREAEANCMKAKSEGRNRVVVSQL